MKGEVPVVGGGLTVLRGGNQGMRMRRDGTHAHHCCGLNLPWTPVPPPPALQVGARPVAVRKAPPPHHALHAAAPTDALVHGHLPQHDLRIVGRRQRRQRGGGARLVLVRGPGPWMAVGSRHFKKIISRFSSRPRIEMPVSNLE